MFADELDKIDLAVATDRKLGKYSRSSSPRWYMQNSDRERFTKENLHRPHVGLRLKRSAAGASGPKQLGN